MLIVLFIFVSMGFGTVFVVHCSFGSSLFLYYHGDYLLKKKIFLVVNSVKSDRWKSSANDVAFELFELAACGLTLVIQFH